MKLAVGGRLILGRQQTKRRCSDVPMACKSQETGLGGAAPQRRTEVLGQDDRRRELMTYATDPRVDDYIDALPRWQQLICRQVRDLVHGADPEVTETIKRTVQPYFVLDGNICALLATRDHVNVFLYDGGMVADPEGIITGGHGNKTGR